MLVHTIYPNVVWSDKFTKKLLIVLLCMHFLGFKLKIQNGVKQKQKTQKLRLHCQYKHKSNVRMINNISN